MIPNRNVPNIGGVLGRPALAAVALAAAGCVDVAEVPLPKAGQVEGEVAVADGSRGDAYLFLYPRTKGAAPEAAVPRYVTAVTDLRLASGDRHFVFAPVQPNPYRLGAFLDVDGNFQPGIDVLAQPGSGDRLADGDELNLQPGERLWRDVAVARPVLREPPAFRLDSPDDGERVLPDQATLFTVAIVVEPLNGALAASRLAFAVSLIDENGDGVPDDLNGDGIPDLFPQAFLRFLPRPGQVVPTDSAGDPATVVVPLAFDPSPFLADLAGNLQAEVATDRLQLFLVPQAQAVTYEPGRGRVVTALDAIPVGAYELVLLARSGQFWRIPNDLATEAGRKVGGPYPGQGVRFRVAHGFLADAGP